MVGTCEEDFWGMVAGWLTNSCMLGGQFCTESACVPGANEDVRACQQRPSLSWSLTHTLTCHSVGKWSAVVIVINDWHVFCLFFASHWRCTYSLTASLPIHHTEVGTEGNRGHCGLAAAYDSTLLWPAAAVSGYSYVGLPTLRSAWLGDEIKTTPKASMGRRMERGVSLPSRLGVWGSLRRSPSGVRGEALAEIDFGAF